MGTEIDRRRAARLLEERGLSALILSEPEGFTYVVGAWPGPASMFRRAGACFVVVPRDIDTPIGAVISDFDLARLMAAAPDVVFRTHPAWIETADVAAAPSDATLEERIEAAIGALDRPTGYSRPATFDLELASGELQTLLADLRITGELGLDLDFVPAADFTALAASLRDFKIANGAPVRDRLQAKKSTREIELLQAGIRFSENGYRRMVAEGDVGHSLADLTEIYRSGVTASAAGQGHVVSTTEYLSLGARTKSRTALAERGDPMKADIVCTVDGYQSDMSRNFVFGAPSADQSRLHAIAEQAYDLGLAALQPGNELSEVHRIVSASLAEQGLPSYRRGHFGHGVGLSVFSEQWPFIAADSDAIIEPNMVLAFEVPLYVEGVASFNVEDQILITETGPVSMNALPRKLEVIA